MNEKQERRPDQSTQEEPTIAPGMETNDDLREEATDEEIQRGDYTEVTQFVIDRTPDDE
ncbi:MULTISPECIES: hypothetical protein [Paenibacillus]|uniref:DUF4025 domain-containing protein n=1 Tax=Paenibacillus lactis TaxID=228574 RepID=A0ABS4F7U3_9BACL|nr:hypothetical protein [Paenibacillus lactis]MBP1892324.1 hypothetical protein [Paenibacillus lactis]MCM3493068.1 hypothetical protein [Paenibacillus lactis]